MTTLVNSFEGGTNGTTISTGNAGGSTGYGAGPQFTNNQFDTILTAATGTITFDNTHAAHGTLAAKATSNASGDKAAVEWVGSLGTQTLIWFREYLYFTANPSGASARVFTEFSSATAAALVNVNTSGKLLMQDSASTQMFIFAGAIPLNQWFRIEGWISNSATVGQAYLALYSSMDALTPTEVHTSAASFNTLASGNTAVFGIAQSAAAIGPYWFDDIGVSTVAPLGPAFFPSAVPQIAPPNFISPGAFDFPASPFTLPNDAPGQPYLMGTATGGTASTVAKVRAPSSRGDTIVVLAAGVNAGNAITGCTDSQNNTYTTVKTLANGGVRGGVFAAVNPVSLGVSDTVTVTWAGSQTNNVTIIGTPGTVLGSAGGNLIPDAAAVASDNAGPSLVGTIPAASISNRSNEIAVAWAAVQPIATTGALNFPPEWTVLLGSSNGTTSPYAVGWKPVKAGSGITMPFAFAGTPTASGVMIVTFMLETRFAPINPRPDMPPGMQSPGAWQYVPGFGEPGSFPYNPGPNRWTEVLAAASVTHPAIIKQAGKQIPATPHPAGQIVKNAGKLVPATPHPAGILVRSTGKTLAATPHPAGALIKVAGKTLAATAHATGLLVKAVGKRIPATPHPAGTLTRAVSKTLPATVHATGRLVKTAVKALAATATVRSRLTVFKVIKALFQAGYARRPWTAGTARTAPALIAAPGLATDPGDWAVPGEMWPGSVWPADVPPPVPVLFATGAARLPWTAGRARPA